jgi:hypothetical protein
MCFDLNNGLQSESERERERERIIIVVDFLEFRRNLN